MTHKILQQEAGALSHKKRWGKSFSRDSLNKYSQITQDNVKTRPHLILKFAEASPPCPITQRQLLLSGNEFILQIQTHCLFICEIWLFFLSYSLTLTFSVGLFTSSGLPLGLLIAASFGTSKLRLAGARVHTGKGAVTQSAGCKKITHAMPESNIWGLKMFLMLYSLLKTKQNTNKPKWHQHISWI